MYLGWMERLRYILCTYTYSTIIIKLSSKLGFVHTYFLLFNPLHLRQFDHTLVVDSSMINCR